MVISPIDFPMYPVSDVSENQVVLSKLPFITARFLNPLGKIFDFLRKKFGWR
ncbi:hypothetical protein VCHE09_2480 [Vibrio paracholerae HE-09]|nr:hypothetical protein VCHE09_2480 [Vibrio paracholerae HE-09]